MFITKAELKLYFNKSVIICAAILTILSLVAGLLGDTLLYNDRLVPQFTLFIADNDKSVESKMLLESLKTFKTNTMKVVACEADEAELAVAGGAAALIIPKGFFADIMSGVNSDAKLIVNRQNEPVSEIIKLFAESIKEQLSASQAGIYYVLSKAPDDTTYTKFMNESNVIYFSAFMSREMQSETAAIHGSVSNKDYYTFCFYVFIMFLMSVLFIEKGNIIKNEAVLTLLLSKSLSISGIVAYKLLSVVICYIVLNIPIMGLMALTGVFSGAGAAEVIALYILLTSVQAAFCTAFIWVFNDIKSAGAFIFVFELAAMFFSGGLLPLVFLPEAFKAISRITPNYYLTSFFISIKTGGSVTGDALIIALFTAAAFAVSFLAALTRKKRYI